MIVKHPDLDASVNIDLSGGVLLLDFLSRGTSQKRAGGKVVGHTRRNPDRRALVQAVLPALAQVLPKSLVVASSARGNVIEARSIQVSDTETVFHLYKQAGNYRWRIWIAPPTPPVFGVLAARFAGRPAPGPDLATLLRRFADAGAPLEPHPKHRPVESVWP